MASNPQNYLAVIKVVGIGGGGVNAVNRMIDAAGCKGLRVGTAEVSPKHANFIQADPGGSADDVLALMAEVRRRVADHAGVELHAETRVVGFPREAVAAAGVGGERPA